MDVVRLCLPGSSPVAAGDGLLLVGYVVKFVSLLVMNWGLKKGIKNPAVSVGRAGLRMALAVDFARF